jgi:PAS domain S-box-containing protein
MAWNRADWLAQMEGVLQTLNEGVLIVDERDGFLFVNRCMEELIGIPAAEALGQKPSRFYSGNDLEGTLRGFRCGTGLRTRFSSHPISQFESKLNMSRLLPLV